MPKCIDRQSPTAEAGWHWLALVGTGWQRRRMQIARLATCRTTFASKQDRGWHECRWLLFLAWPGGCAMHEHGLGWGGRHSPPIPFSLETTAEPSTFPLHHTACCQARALSDKAAGGYGTAGHTTLHHTRRRPCLTSAGRRRVRRRAEVRGWACGGSAGACGCPTSDGSSGSAKDEIRRGGGRESRSRRPGTRATESFLVVAALTLTAILSLMMAA